MKSIRLTAKEIDAIKMAFVARFQPGDKLWIFGSRVYAEKRGGDIDLYIETTLSDADTVIKARFNFLADIKIAIGDQKIDVVINRGSMILPIYEVAQQEGIQLV